MPVYEYQCLNSTCGRPFELNQRFSDPIATECIHCHGPVRKLFSRPAIVFKGSGWYVTDSRKPEADGESAGASPKPDTAAPSPKESVGSEGAVAPSTPPAAAPTPSDT
ncbi:MAG: FmdB family transcriptional regulator [Chloroflexi bacterium]|nr:FmdB family transcriptional regulator [Chloroflexota bacterium]